MSGFYQFTIGRPASRAAGQPAPLDTAEQQNDIPPIRAARFQGRARGHFFEGTSHRGEAVAVAALQMIENGSLDWTL